MVILFGILLIILLAEFIFIITIHYYGLKIDRKMQTLRTIQTIRKIIYKNINK